MVAAGRWADLLAPDAEVAHLARDFPDSWVQGDLTLPLTYSFGEVGANEAVAGRKKIENVCQRELA